MTALTCTFRIFDQQHLRTMRRCHEPGLGGVVSLEPQPFLQCHEAAPKPQWVMVQALWHGASGWLDRLRLLRGGFKGKGAVGRLESISGCGLARDHTPRPGLMTSMHRAKMLLVYDSKTIIASFRVGTNYRDQRLFKSSESLLRILVDFCSRRG